MAQKRNNKYKITLEELELKDGTAAGRNITFNFNNHDDIFHLIDLTKDSFGFEDKAQNTEFMVGLKLFSEVMLKNRKHELFEEFFPAFGEFMKKLKSGVK